MECLTLDFLKKATKTTKKFLYLKLAQNFFVALRYIFFPLI